MGLIKEAGKQLQGAKAEVEAGKHKAAAAVNHTEAKIENKIARDRFSGPRKALGHPGAAEGIAVSSRPPANASPLMKQVYQDTVGSVRRGNVPPGLFVTTHNAASSQVLLKGPAI